MPTPDDILQALYRHLEGVLGRCRCQQRTALWHVQRVMGVKQAGTLCYQPTWLWVDFGIKAY